MKVRLSAINARRKSRCQLTAGGGEGGGQEGYENTPVFSPPLALPLLSPKGYMRLLVLTVDVGVCLFLNAAQRQTSGLMACADPFNTGVQCS